MTDTALRFLVLAAAIVQIVVPVYVNPFRGGRDGLDVAPPSMIEPAGYAFAIWGPIYLAAVAYAIFQLLPAGRADPVTARIAPYAIILYAGSSLWLCAAQYGPVWATMPILFVMAVAGVVALLIATGAPEPTTARFWLIVVPFGVYAGWATCATFVNIAEVAPGYGFNRFGLSIPTYAIASLIAATLVAGTVVFLSGGSVPYAATVLWALVAIIVAAQMRGHPTSITVVAAVAAMAVVSLTVAARAAIR
jgi:hypothetical protein